jgi:4-hydroxy-2-oxoheptanedioate aldolase
MVQIEHIEGVRNIDAILSVPGIDACYIGPNDLCASMGLAPSLDPPHREYEEAVQTIFRVAQKHGVVPGIHCGTPEMVRRRIAEGWRFVGCASELSHLLAATRACRAIIEG